MRTQRAVATKKTKALATGDFGLHGSIKPTHYRPAAGITLEQAAHDARLIGDLESACPWAIGDLMAYAETHFGEKAPAVFDESRYEAQTLLNRAAVSRSVEPSRRREDLSWSHHEAVSGLEPDMQTHWLAKAAEGDPLPAGDRRRWSQKRLRDELRAALPEATKRQRKALPQVTDPQPVTAPEPAQDPLAPPPATETTAEPAPLILGAVEPVQPQATVTRTYDSDPVTRRAAPAVHLVRGQAVYFEGVDGQFLVVGIYQSEGQVVVKCIPDPQG